MRAALLLLAALSGDAFAQDVYKCRGADGALTFSQQPCGDHAETVTIKAHEPSAADRAQAAARLRMSSVGLDGEYRICVDRAQRSIGGSTGRSINANNARIRQIEGRIRMTNNNLAGATLEAGLRQEIAALHQANAALQASADEALRAAETQCQQERARREEAALSAARGQGADDAGGPPAE
jgi:hypothetical protein